MWSPGPDVTALVWCWTGNSTPQASVAGTVALVGKVYCKVDADPAPIQVGDLLTTSSRAGHAQKVLSRPDAFGAVLGKAMGSLANGQGLIPVLVALQ